MFESPLRPIEEALRHPPVRARTALWAWLFDLFADGNETDRERLLQQLRTTARGRAPALDDSLAALRVELTRRPRDVTRTLATLDASYFAVESRSLSERRRMLASVAPREALAPTERDRKELATALLAGPVVRFHEGPREGALDPRAVVAIAALHSDSIYGVLVDAFGVDALADGLAIDRVGAAKLYEQLGGAPRDRASFLRELSLLRPEAARDGRAVALIGASVTDPTLRTALDARVKLADHAQVFARAAALAGDFTLKPKRATRLAKRLVERLGVADQPTLLRVASEGTEPLGSFGDHLLGTLGRRFDERIVELLEAAADGLRLAERVAEATTFPFLVERTLAERWRDHPDDARRAFAGPRLPKPPPAPPATSVRSRSRCVTPSRALRASRIRCGRCAQRIAVLRLEVAYTLARRGNPIGAPLLVEDVLTKRDLRIHAEVDPRAAVLGALALGEHEPPAGQSSTPRSMGATWWRGS